LPLRNVAIAVFDEREDQDSGGPQQSLDFQRDHIIYRAIWI